MKVGPGVGKGLMKLKVRPGVREGLLEVEGKTRCAGGTPGSRR